MLSEISVYYNHLQKFRKPKILLLRLFEQINMLALNTEEVMKQEVVYEYSCTTPKGKRFRIPENSACPPAPKKRRSVGTSATKCSSKRRSLSDDALIFSPIEVEVFFFYEFRKNNIVKSSNDLFN